MLKREEMLKQEIEARFGNVKAFANSIDVPYTTVRTILERGVANARLDNIFKICDGLSLPITILNPMQTSQEQTFYNEFMNSVNQLTPDQQNNLITYTQSLLEEPSNTLPDSQIELSETLANTVKSHKDQLKKKKKK